ncbi:Bro-N domain-containing protein [Aliiroseovarius crassostreae]|uniref:BRO-N domain-containing protein n=1 Tax=Aliiroseovarius crassostreae TaxID=154981 RepID=UPI0021FFB6EA|nr:Bro-N domain-containing protein [Aliiroseovarius crassostreae]UWQ03973.1 Bro-N domain-containing protein [Aliiroseovarius crassostreae]
MTDQLKTFEAPALGNLKFTVWDREGEPWFIAKEVFDVLGFTGNAVVNYLRRLDEEEKTKEKLANLTESKVWTGNSIRWFISESGLYKLIMRSNKPEAQQFQDWVTKVVLPAIRKDGANPPPYM